MCYQFRKFKHISLCSLYVFTINVLLPVLKYNKPAKCPWFLLDHMEKCHCCLTLVCITNITAGKTYYFWNCQALQNLQIKVAFIIRQISRDPNAHAYKHSENPCKAIFSTLAKLSFGIMKMYQYDKNIQDIYKSIFKIGNIINFECPKCISRKNRQILF